MVAFTLNGQVKVYVRPSLPSWFVFGLVHQSGKLDDEDVLLMASKYMYNRYICRSKFDQEFIVISEGTACGYLHLHICNYMFGTIEINRWISKNFMKICYVFM